VVLVVVSLKGLQMSFRKALWCVFFLGVFCAAGSFIGQYVLGMNPCVRCIEQRVAVIVTTLLAFVCACCSNRSCIVRVINAVVMSVAPVAGLGVAIYQIYIQHLPLVDQPSCGAPWTFRLRDAPLFELYEPIIRGSGNCGEVQRILWIPLPVWSVLFFSFVLLWVWVWLWRSRCKGVRK
jgi:protein dithiol:quinone oxidoreductase